MPRLKKGFIPRWAVLELPHCESHRPGDKPELFQTRAEADDWIEHQYKTCPGLSLRFNRYKLGPADKITREDYPDVE